MGLGGSAALVWDWDWDRGPRQSQGVEGSLDGVEVWLVG